ncbi:MAG: L-proline dehydrogenase, partial [Planctomycetes bacterium]|nr:L-proline dehydrogenase [Planctomycetota bacterium]
MQWLHEAILRGLPWVPRTLVRRIAGRYIAGESLADSLGVVTALERQGLLTTVDVLGENVRSREEARRATEEYLELVERL